MGDNEKELVYTFKLDVNDDNKKACQKCDNQGQKN